MQCLVCTFVHIVIIYANTNCHKKNLLNKNAPFLTITTANTSSRLGTSSEVSTIWAVSLSGTVLGSTSRTGASVSENLGRAISGFFFTLKVREGGLWIGFSETERGGSGFFWPGETLQFSLRREHRERAEVAEQEAMSLFFFLLLPPVLVVEPRHRWAASSTAFSPRPPSPYEWATDWLILSFPDDKFVSAPGICRYFFSTLKFTLLLTCTLKIGFLPIIHHYHAFLKLCIHRQNHVDVWDV